MHKTEKKNSFHRTHKNSFRKDKTNLYLKKNDDNVVV